MKRLLPWVVIGLALRLFLASFTVHPDIRGYNFAAYIISQKGELLTFYDHLRLLPRTDPITKVFYDDLFIYPPTSYLTIAMFTKVLWPIYPPQTFDLLILDIGKVLGQPGLSRLLFLSKFHFFVIDAIGLLLISKLNLEKDQKLLAQLLWIFNPVSIYSSYMMGQVDIMIALIILGVLLLWQRKNYLLAVIVLGLGATIKQSPWFLLPFLVFSSTQNTKARIGLILAGLLPYLLVISPYLGSIGFRQYALLANLTDKIFFAKVPISGAFDLPLFLLIYFCSVWFCWAKSEKYSVWQWFLFPLLAFYSLVHFHPQWLVWVSPLFIILLATDFRKFWLPILVLLGCYLGMILMFEPSLNIDLFAPLIGHWNTFSIYNFLDKFYSARTLGNIIRSIFAATSIFMLYSLSVQSRRRA